LVFFAKINAIFYLSTNTNSKDLKRPQFLTSDANSMWWEVDAH